MFYNIIDCEEKGILVTILTTESTGVYWNDLQQSLSKSNWANRTVFFDFVFRNGERNRFYYAQLNEMSKLTTKLQKCEISAVCCRMEANKYFSDNLCFLEGSILTENQREAFIKDLAY